MDNTSNNKNNNTIKGLAQCPKCNSTSNIVVTNDGHQSQYCLKCRLIVMRNGKLLS